MIGCAILAGLEVLNKRLAVSITDTLIDWCSKLDLILFQ